MQDGTGEVESKTEYRVWNAFRSKLGACIVNGVNNIYMKPGSKVLYLGAANGTTVSHVSDLIGEVIVISKIFFSSFLDWNRICSGNITKKWQRFN